MVSVEADNHALICTSQSEQPSLSLLKLHIFVRTSQVGFGGLFIHVIQSQCSTLMGISLDNAHHFKSPALRAIPIFHSMFGYLYEHLLKTPSLEFSLGPDAPQNLRLVVFSGAPPHEVSHADRGDITMRVLAEAVALLKEPHLRTA